MITFNRILHHEGIDPTNVLLLRHQEHRGARAPKPYDLWRVADGRFETYQALQSRNCFPVGALLASFVATPTDQTLFVGLYKVQGVGNVPVGIRNPVAPEQDVTGYFWYKTPPDGRMAEYTERLVLDWGKGYRSWLQRAHRQDKIIVELRRKGDEPPFPGFAAFITSLSEIDSLPKSWIEVLRNGGGVYLLTCPHTKEQYIGSATGVGGFWQRFQEYARTGHGGNIQLKSRSPSDYRVSILEVAGSASSQSDILQMEERWKAKLQSRDMGLNRN